MDYANDVFISHASEDKDKLVRVLATKLVELGLKVWYDEFTLEIGDSLSGSIDKGLASSRYGVVVLSKAFLAKSWPEYELRGLLARQIGGEKVILPIWHEITREDLLKYSPSLADAKAIDSRVGIDTLASQLLSIIRPDIHKMYQVLDDFQSKIAATGKLAFSSGNIKISPRRREKLNDSQLVRIHILRLLLGSLHSRTLDEMYDSFLRDLRVDNELYLWERATLTMLLYRQQKPDVELEEARSVLRLFLVPQYDFLQRIVADEDYKAQKSEELGIDLELALQIFATILKHPDLGKDALGGHTLNEIRNFK